MTLPISLPVEPMLARSVPRVPRPKAAGDLVYEPKWDGFRCLVLRDGESVELASRGGKPLTRYFPEVVEAALRLLPPVIALDAEIVVRSGRRGHQHLDWEALTQRIHPAASRVNRLAAETPAEIVAFDLLALGDEDLMPLPLVQRRARLEDALAHLAPGDPIHLTRTTTDPDLAEAWFDRFEGAGLDGVMAKPAGEPYAPGRRTMFKVKHSRTAEAVVLGYRVHKSGHGVGSLLLGLHDDDGNLRNVGGVSAFTNATRLALVDELAPLVRRDADGEVEPARTDRSRFSASKDVSFVPLEPELVVEVRFDQLEGDRFRHAVQFERWRPDRTAESCTLAQIERAPAYDLDEVLSRPGGA